MDLVPGGDRARTVPDRRHMVADGDGCDDDLPDSGRHSGEAWLGDTALLRYRAGGGHTGGKAGPCGTGRIARHSEALAVDGADDLGRSGSVCEAVLVGYSGVLFHR